MSGFLTPLRTEYIDGKKWLVTEPFSYHLGEPDGEEVVAIEAGFITDFASIPRMLWTAWPPTGKYGKAAVIHDKLYQDAIVMSLTPLRDVWTGNKRVINRGEADKLLLEAMEVLGVGYMTRGTIYSGVRLGGWWSWRKHRKHNDK